jgi:glycolate oxidase
MQTQILDALKAIVGTDNIIAPEHASETIVMPGCTEEVSKVLSLANNEKLPVYTRETPTSPIPSGEGLVLVLTRMNRILDIDAANLVARAEAGVTVALLNREVADFGLMYPPDPGTTTDVTLGGIVADNAAGLHGLKYGATKHYVMGLEVVLADGRILKTGGKNVKDVAGYDLTKLITGARNTLGVITSITVKLMPAPENTKTMFVAFNKLDNAGKAISGIIAAKTVPATLEILDRVTARAVEASGHFGLPATAEALLFIELDGIAAAVEKDAAIVISILKECGADEICVAKDPAERDAFWTIRRCALSALAQAAPHVLTEDVTVPRGHIADMIKEIITIAEKYTIKVGTFGHAGEGNLLPTFACDLSNEAEKDRIYTAINEIFEAARALGGTMHGNSGFVAGTYGLVGVSAMQTVKRAFDPNCILNPGKLVGEC